MIDARISAKLIGAATMNSQSPASMGARVTGAGGAAWVASWAA